MVDGRPVDIEVVKLAGTEVEVGETIAEEKQLRLSAQPKNHFWKIEMTPGFQYYDDANKEHSLVLVGTNAGKEVKIKFNSFTELKSPLYM